MSRSFFVDLFKLVASQLIVLHHLSAYGPMAEAIKRQWPALMDHLYRDARLAVQVFLVMGGYLAAQSLMGKREVRPLDLIQRRYLRLMPSYVLALCWVSALVWWLRPVISGDWLVETPTLHSVLAHLTMLQSVLDLPALSVGVWYVAADFQLYALLALMAYVFKAPKTLSLTVAALCVSSMWRFNRVDELDSWAIYFFAAYGLGVLAGWAKRSAFDKGLFVGVLLLGIGALWVEPRTRLALAMVSALVMIFSGPHVVRHPRLHRVASQLADSAYAMFLTHFGVIVVFSAVWELLRLNGSSTALWLSGLAWLCSIAVGWVFHTWGEAPLMRWSMAWFARPHSTNPATATTQPGHASIAAMRAMAPALGLSEAHMLRTQGPHSVR